jgi:hypothetical protein
MKQLTLEILKAEANKFCKIMSLIRHPELDGITDGKAVGTFVEKRFKDMLLDKYSLSIGNAARGIDLPGDKINTDIKTTSIKQPQSSSPFRNAKQKIRGLGYNLLVFVYHKDDRKKFNLEFVSCVFIEKELTGDYRTTKRIIEMIKDGCNEEDISSYLSDINLPLDDITLNELSKELLKNPPSQGYLTISNALQWRLQYRRIINLNNRVRGIKQILKYT